MREYGLSYKCIDCGEIGQTNIPEAVRCRACRRRKLSNDKLYTSTLPSAEELRKLQSLEPEAMPLIKTSDFITFLAGRTT